MPGARYLLLLLAAYLLILGGLLMVGLEILQSIEPSPPSPILVQADYERCVRIAPGPIVRSTGPRFNPHVSEIV